MTFPQTHVDGEAATAAWINDIESRAAAYVLGQVGRYRGTYNASTNTPTLAAGTGVLGDFYKVATAGTQDLGAGSTSFVVGDFVTYDGAVWQRQTGLLSGIDYGNVFTSQFRGAPSSQSAVGAFTWHTLLHIPVGATPTITGLEYQVGSAGAGTVKPCIYGTDGNLLATRASGITQLGANASQTLDFDAAVVIPAPGRYGVSLEFSSGSATFVGANSRGLLTLTTHPASVAYSSFGSILPPVINTY